MGAISLADAIGGYRNGGIRIARHLEAAGLVVIRKAGKTAGRDAYEISLTKRGRVWAEALAELESEFG